MFKMYNKQWKRIFEFTHVNEFNQPVDTDGVIHENKSLRPVKPTDRGHGD